MGITLAKVQFNPSTLKASYDNSAGKAQAIDYFGDVKCGSVCLSPKFLWVSLSGFSDCSCTGIPTTYYSSNGYGQSMNGLYGPIPRGANLCTWTRQFAEEHTWGTWSYFLYDSTCTDLFRGPHSDVWQCFEIKMTDSLNPAYRKLELWISAYIYDPLIDYPTGGYCGTDRAKKSWYGIALYDEGNRCWDANAGTPDTGCHRVLPLGAGNSFVKTQGGTFKIHTGSPCDWAEPWSGTIQYKLHDAVIFMGTCYMCIAEHLNKVPPNPAYWTVIG